jgi:hypothetical protein
MVSFLSSLSPSLPKALFSYFSEPVADLGDKACYLLNPWPLAWAPQPSTWGRVVGLMWLQVKKKDLERSLGLYFSEAWARNLGDQGHYLDTSVIESQSPSHLLGEPTRQGQSLALKSALVPSTLMALHRHQILVASKQNLDAPIPRLLGNTPSLPQALLSWPSLIANNPQLNVPAFQPPSPLTSPLPASPPCFSPGDEFISQCPLRSSGPASVILK